MAVKAGRQKRDGSIFSVWKTVFHFVQELLLSGSNTDYNQKLTYTYKILYSTKRGDDSPMNRDL